MRDRAEDELCTYLYSGLRHDRLPGGLNTVLGAVAADPAPVGVAFSALRLQMALKDRISAERAKFGCVH